MKRMWSVFLAFMAMIFGLVSNASAALDFSAFTIDIAPIEALTMLIATALVGFWLCKAALAFLSRAPK